MNGKNLIKMWFCVFTIAMATNLLSISAEDIPDWETWPRLELPKMHKEELHETDTISNINHIFSDLKAEKSLQLGDEYFNLESITNSLSFHQTSAKNLSDIQRTRVTLDDARELLKLKILAGEISDNAFSTDRDKLRRKRDIFGDDTRYQITKEFRTVFPFSATAQLSSGCSGVLIGPRHVLTAAECIHNGKRYRGNAKNLRVGLIPALNLTASRSSRTGKRDRKRDTSLDWRDVAQIYIPDGWVSPSYGEKRDTFNYAVLELAENHNLNCMEVGVSSTSNTNRRQRIHFSSFDDYEYKDKPVLAYRHCSIEHVSESRNYLYEKCDFTKSSVGAGIYLRLWDNENWQWSRRVMAVKTSEYKRIRVRGRVVKVGRDVRLTLLNFGQICYWVMRDFEACSRGRIEDACLMA